MQRDVPAPSVGEVTCAHCDLPVPSGLVRPEQTAQFCCQGCRAAYTLIHDRGLEAYYRLRPEAPATPPASATTVRFDDFDRPGFLAQFSATSEGGRRVTFALAGIHCAACVWLLEKLPQIVPGVTDARVDWARRTIDLQWNPELVSLSAVAAAIDRLGYRPHPLRDDTVERLQVEDERQQLVRLAVAGAAAGNNMLIAGSLYLGMFSYMSGSALTLLRVASCLVGLVSLLGPGRVFFRGAIVALRAGVPHMDLPIALGLGAGGVAGLVNTLRGSGEIYFDTLSVLVFLLLLGRWIQHRQQRRAASAVSMLDRLTPRTAHRVVDGRVVDVPSEVLEVGDAVEVRAGETIPSDGTVLRGRSSVDQSLLTGESLPVAVTPDDEVAAGTLNLSAAIVVGTTAVGAQTRIGKILDLMERAAAGRAPIVALADRIGAWFVVVVVGLAVATFAGWWMVDPALALPRAVTLLIVACPCALALATPLTLSVAIGRAAGHGILIKGGDVLQRVTVPGTMWLDKTGTLTQGRSAMLGWSGDPSARPLVAALEAESAHPTARALVEGLGAASDPALRVVAVQQSDRGGIRGTVDGHDVVLGHERFVAASAGAPPPDLAVAADRWLAAGASPVFVAVDGRITAVTAVGDPLRPDARASLDAVRARGFRVGILSGDHPRVVARVGAQLGLDASACHGGLTPEDKVRFIRETPTVGSSVMVGDGVNDSAALAAADVGIATKDGAEASLRAAPVYLARPGLASVIDLLDAGTATMKTIRRTFGASLAYNAVCVSLAITGLITPLLAAVLMPLSSLTVVGVAIAGGRRVWSR
jgi:Cu2+-exporting ATPase